MITRKHGYIFLRENESPNASEQIEHQGYTVLRRVFSPIEIATLRDEVLRVFAELPPPRHRVEGNTPGNREDFRYEMLNVSSACQRVVADRRILDVIEPLLGEWEIESNMLKRIS